MQSWQRWREPAAVLLLVLLALTLVVRAVGVGLAFATGNTGGWLGSVPTADHLLLLLASGAVLWCATPVEADGGPPSLSPHVWPIAVLGVVIVGLTVLGWTALAAWDVVTFVSSPSVDLGLGLLIIEGVLRLAVPVASLVAVIAGVRRAAAARAPTGSQALPAAASPASPPPAVAAAPERLPAAWQADEATGAVWLTADDAARGRPGLSWTDPDAAAGSASEEWAPPVVRAEERLADGAGRAPEPGHPPAPPSASEDDDLR